MTKEYLKGCNGIRKILILDILVGLKPNEERAKYSMLRTSFKNFTEY